MRILLLVGAFFLIANKGMSQTATPRPEKFGNATIDAYIDSVYTFVDKQKGLSATLDTLEMDIVKARDNEDEDAIDGLIARFTGLEASYKALEESSKSLTSETVNATKATTQCGMKAPKCATGIKDASALLKDRATSMIADKAKMAEIKAKAEAAKKAYEQADN